jgi:hypothetical protein
MALAKVERSNANPYAGITQVRFKGYLLSPYGTPVLLAVRLFQCFSKIKFLYKGLPPAFKERVKTNTPGTSCFWKGC